MKYANCHPDRVYYGKGQCKPCYMREWHSVHKEYLAAYARKRYPFRRAVLKARNRRYLYGVTLDQYRDMLVGQAGRCLVCLRVPDHDLHVDHDHATGRVRGLLCKKCNRGIGLLEDSPRLVASAARYLGRSSA